MIPGEHLLVERQIAGDEGAAAGIEEKRGGLR